VQGTVAFTLPSRSICRGAACYSHAVSYSRAASYRCLHSCVLQELPSCWAFNAGHACMCCLDCWHRSASTSLDCCRLCACTRACRARSVPSQGELTMRCQVAGADAGFLQAMDSCMHACMHDACMLHSRSHESCMQAQALGSRQRRHESVPCRSAGHGALLG
jgi:hypothetical protein